MSTGTREEVRSATTMLKMTTIVEPERKKKVGKGRGQGGKGWTAPGVGRHASIRTKLLLARVLVRAHEAPGKDDATGGRGGREMEEKTEREEAAKKSVASNRRM
jgi:hypothetical protein